tara:strand:- start:1136 stop:1513 length:378 start_codon:yes stop_codon:yes gene_type:complete
MIVWITKQAVISLLIIILAHSIYSFLQSNLTTPKVKDLINKPIRQYNQIYNTTDNTALSTNSKKKQSVSKEEDTAMKNELQNYFKELSGKKLSQTTAENLDRSEIMSKSHIQGVNNEFTDSFETV